LLLERAMPAMAQPIEGLPFLDTVPGQRIFSYSNTFKLVPPANWLHRTSAAHAPLDEYVGRNDIAWIPCIR